MGQFKTTTHISWSTDGHGSVGPVQGSAPPWFTLTETGGSIRVDMHASAGPWVGQFSLSGGSLQFLGDSSPAPSFTTLTTGSATAQIADALLQELLEDSTATAASGQTFSDGQSGLYGDQGQALVTQASGQTLLLAALPGQSALSVFAYNGNSANHLATLTDSSQSFLSQITGLSSLVIGGKTYVVAASSNETGLSIFELTSSGQLTPKDSVLPSDGLWVSTITAMATANVAGQAFVLVAAAGSGSLSVVQLASDGSAEVVDHVLDDLTTRFASISHMEVLSTATGTYVAVSGSDDGISLYALLPSGQLMHLTTLSDTTDLGLGDISGLSMVSQGGELHIFASSEREPGLTHLIYDPGPAGPITGSSGNDQLTGTAGADTLIDGAGADLLSGGAGADTFVFVRDGALDEVLDFELGQDRVDISQWDGLYSTLQLDITALSNGAELRFEDETLILRTANGASLSLEDFLATDILGIARIAPPDTPPPALLQTFTGTSGTDSFLGNGLDNEIRGNGGNDSLLGGSGHDTLYGDAGDDILAGDQDDDTLYGGIGQDWLTGGAGHDSLYGHDGTDQLYGGDGNDALFDGTGRDTLTGGSGADRFYLSSDGAVDEILDFEVGHDLINLDHWAGLYSTAQLEISTLSNGAQLRFGNETLILRTANGASLSFGDFLATDILGIARVAPAPTPTPTPDVVEPPPPDNTPPSVPSTYIVEFSGSGGADSFSGNPMNNRISGKGGNDRLSGGAGNDIIRGGDGNDTVNGNSGHDTLYGDAGHDQIYGGEGTDKLYGGTGADTLRGGDGDDRLSGDSAVDVLYGGPGADYLSGGTGADTLYGDKGDDQLYSNTGVDLVYGGDGNDFISPGNGVDIAYGGNGNDHIIGRTGWDTLYGDAGNDRLYGSQGQDKLYGGEGDDYLSGGYGYDKLWGGNGNDTMYGNIGQDTLYGNAGHDTLYGASGDDLLKGGSGNDTIFGAQGHDTLIGEAGNDYLRPGTLSDVLIFKPGHDRDTISGLEGQDEVRLSTRLTGGLTKPSDIFDRFAMKVGDDWALSFGGGDMIIFEDIRSSHAVIDVLHTF